MSVRISLQIALKFIKARSNNGFVSFLSCFSIVATALGIAVLITVMSVMNGFDYEIKSLVFNNESHIIISDNFGYINDWHTVVQKLKSQAGVVSVDPVVEVQSLISLDDNMVPAVITGVSPTSKEYSNLKNSKFGIILSANYANRIGASVGDKVLLITPSIKNTVLGPRPKLHKFNVVAIVKSDKFVSKQIARLEDIQNLLGIGNSVTSINLKMTSLDSAPLLANKLRADANFFYSVSSWSERYAQLFKALRLQKTMMFLILALIIVIASFNMLSSMVMLVSDKRSSIAVLRTIGFSRYQIMLSFIFQGLIIGLVGIFLGTILGMLLSNYVTEIVNLLELLLGFKLVDKSVYMLDYLPSHIEVFDILFINITALVFSILATIYPSLKAAKIKPGIILKEAL